MEITLEELKKQVRVDYTEEDDLLTLYAEAAEEIVVNATNRTMEELKGMGKGKFPLPLRVATLKMAAEMFTNRSVTTAGTVNVLPHGYEALIRPFVRLKERE